MINARLRSVWSTDQVPGYSRLYTESILKRKRGKEKEKGEGKRGKRRGMRRRKGGVGRGGKLNI